VDALPQASVAVTVTSVVPMENWLPDAGTEVIVTGPPQLSVAVGVKETATVQKPIGVVAVIFAGQVTTGAVWSLTVMICVQFVMLPEASVAR